eukprot:TRINITY_DN9840_c0_g1_i1.p1 TRINITY_DN9840_c0_g1~~TRINITY_DN9840_c0_g1_i1.p1  ORF type:complete len:295 (+),score=20.63 TRINITY_DN9840_c0_g1_i1:187-1071(+)
MSVYPLKLGEPECLRLFCSEAVQMRQIHPKGRQVLFQGKKVPRLLVSGVVVMSDIKTNNTSFTIDDGSSLLPCIVWHPPGVSVNVDQPKPPKLGTVVWVKGLPIHFHGVVVQIESYGKCSPTDELTMWMEALLQKQNGRNNLLISNTSAASLLESEVFTVINYAAESGISIDEIFKNSRIQARANCDQKCYEDTVQSAVNKLTNDGLIYFCKEISKYRVLSNQSQINEAIQSAMESLARTIPRHAAIPLESILRKVREDTRFLHVRRSLVFYSLQQSVKRKEIRSPAFGKFMLH